MTTTTRTKLTKTQREILLHRLTVPDAIGDAVGERMAAEAVGIPDDEWDVPEHLEAPFDEALESALELIGPAIERLERHFDSGGELSTLGNLSDVEKEVLADCIDGSVWIGCMEGNCPDSLIARHYNIGCELAAMVSEAIGQKVEFPNH